MKDPQAVLHGLPDAELARLVARVAAKRPRVQCLTNTVAQTYTAHALVAIGAEPSMAVHPAEIIAMAGSADALLINLGTLDPQREAAIQVLNSAKGGFNAPLVLDPVMIDRSSFRRALAMLFLDYPRLIVKGNEREMALLRPVLTKTDVAVTTGPVDRVTTQHRVYEIDGGHPLMARFSGSGCLAGAVIAAFATVEQDRALAAAAALQFLRQAAETAGSRAGGPGSFMADLLDALAASTDHALQVNE